MNEYVASYSQLEKIVNAFQSMKDTLVCRICLEWFNEPVTIRCGHKFCKSCILQVAANDNAACPFCNIKIQKRSIPKESNKLLQACVDRVKNLAKAILDDSGVDVTQPYNKVKHTKESVVLNETLDNSRFDVNSVASFSGLSLANQSIRSKVLSGNTVKGKKSVLRKKQTNTESLKSLNTLFKYLSNKTEFEPEPVQPNEKVTSWLKNITPASDSAAPDSVYDEVLPTSSKANDAPSDNKSPFTSLKESHEASLPKVYPSKKAKADQSPNQETDQIEEPKYKEVQLRVQEAEMARKKKLSQTVPEGLLKTPCSVPAASHSDVNDWRRVKKYGKEMQVKTFKSLHVSVEKNTSYAVTDDGETGPSGVNDVKNASKESDAKNSPHDLISSRIRQKKMARTDFFETKDSPKNVIKDYKRRSTDSTPSNFEENISVSCMDEKKIKEIIGIPSKNSSSASEKNKNISSVTNVESTSSSHKLITEDNQENKGLDDDQQSVKSSGSPMKRKVCLKMKLKPSDKPKPVCSPIKTPVKMISDSPLSYSPEPRPKSRVSLRLASKTAENPVKTSKPISLSIRSPSKSPVKQPVESPMKIPEKPSIFQKINCNTLPSTSSSHKPIMFKKLGRICKVRKKVPFLHLGKIRPKEILAACNELTSGIIIKSVVPVHVNSKIVKMLSPEKDSQLKFLALESPDRPPKVNKAQKNEPVISEQNKPSETTNLVDKSQPKIKTSRKKLAMDKEEALKSKVIPNSQESTGKDKSSTSRSSARSHDKTVVEASAKTTANVPDNSSKTNPVKQKDVTEPMDTSDKESSKASSKKRTKAKPVKQKPVKEVDLISISSNDSEKKPKRTKTKTVKEKPIQELDAISVSSNESGKRPRRTRAVREIGKRCANAERKNSEVESDTTNYQKSLTASTTSSPVVRSPTKKRAHPQALNDEDDDDTDVASIIDKWCDPNVEPLSKKPKVITHLAQVHRNFTQEDENTYANTNVPLPKRDSPIDNIINRYKASKESELNKLQNAMPSSLNSADLFDTNEPSIIQPTIQNLPKQPVDDTSDRSSPSKNSDKENLQTTVLQNKKFKPIENLAEKSDTSDKENNELTPKGDNDAYHVHESLMNITQEQIDIKRVEKALIGVDLSIAGSPKADDKFTTPTRKKPTSQQESEFDTDNIDATPVVKKRQSYNFARIKHIAEENGMSSPERDLNIIPAVTPVKKTKSYPLCHSTPLSVIGSSHRPVHSRNITIVTSSLTPDEKEVISEFTKKFQVKFKDNFTLDVTHVIVHTDPATKCGQKTSKYIQGIAFKKYVVSVQWIVDCLAQNTLLDENDEKYAVLDTDTQEDGARKSRERVGNLFKGFAFYCLEPFSPSLPVNDLKNILLFNGATVARTPKELSFQRDIRIIVLESENLSPMNICRLKKSGGALVSFEWVIDSISQYSLLSIVSYLYETSVEEALALGIPQEHLVVDEVMEEDDDE